MKFSDLSPGYFVVIKPEESVGLLVKDTKGRVRFADYNLLEGHSIGSETEVQKVHLK
ncbi:MAG: hypothetical protein AAB352_01670 [Patescibacteria group bacterium]